MSNEESLIPSVGSFVTPLMAVYIPFYIGNLWVSAMKSYGEQVRRITLEEAADKAETEFDDTRPFSMEKTVVKDSILQLNQSDRLKIS